MSGPDRIVVGAGHNGLVHALYRAQQGERVLVLEQHEAPGGLARRHEIAALDGMETHVADGVLNDTWLFSSVVERELGLAEFGLERIEDADAGVQVVPVEGEAFRLRTPDSLTELVGSFRTYLRGVAERCPPALQPDSFGDLASLLRAGMRLRGLGRASMLELLRVAPMSVADLLREHTDDDALAEALALPGLVASFAGPWTAGTALNLLFTEALRERPVAGGTGKLIEVLVSACQARGVELRCGVAVTDIRIEGGAVTGVETQDGEFIACDQVASAADPKTTLLELVQPEQLPIALEEEVANIRTRGTLARVNVVLKGGLAMAQQQPELRLTTGSLDGLERVFDAVKYGQLPEQPVLDVRIVTGDTNDVSYAIDVAYCPHRADDQALEEVVCGRMSLHEPNVLDRIVACEFMTPAAIEARYGVSGGQPLHAEPALDQFGAMRPSIHTARYRTPIAGLTLCGSSQHPMGGITGLPGRNAARHG